MEHIIISRPYVRRCLCVTVSRIVRLALLCAFSTCTVIHDHHCLTLFVFNMYEADDMHRVL